ncbi:MAG: UDP-N-acetylmuramoyl-tripeptide--D-alanyl-D-alanine ligase [Verrucomicrobia bacterium ADurb.Bin345]|nr:MAG: UDP-N-acetylmuramoyl-tripeptide--D-alanyl-D-alanine ligase [Verrucomicrobia bacterium ADurb.Bin345]
MPSFDAQELAGWCEGGWDRMPIGPFCGVCTDTRALRPGELFVAIRGPNHDGHDFVAEAFARGAAGAMVEKGRSDLSAGSAPLLKVEDSLLGLRRMAQEYRRALKAEFVAVTGSSGKTTVKEMIADVCASLGPTARTRGNWNNDIGLPLSLLGAERNIRYGVFEVGMNHRGELAPLCDILKPNWGVVTNVGPVHLEFFDSVEEIAKEKAVVPASLPPGGTAVLDRDGPYYEILLRASPCRVVTISLGLDADFSGEVRDAATGAFSVRESATGQSADFRLGVPGRHMIADALFAVAVGRALGVEWKTLQDVLASFRPPPLRWTQISVNGVDVINDAYNANPMSMVAALEAFSRVESRGRKWLVLGGMRELGSAEECEHVRLGRLVAEGDWSGLVAVGSLGGIIARSARESARGFLKVVECADHREAAAALKMLAAPGDAVLLKASRAEALERILKEWTGAGEG